MASDTFIKIPSELFAMAESSRFEGTCDLQKLVAGPDDYVFDGPVEWAVDITNTGGAFLLAGTAWGSATTACARCLEDAHFDLEGDIEGYLLISPDSEGYEERDEDDDELEDDEFEVLSDEHSFDLRPYIESALIMDVPYVPLCKDDCAGLCPQCGANLNEGPCGCGKDAALEGFEQAANPFSVLAGYDFGD